MKVVVLGTAAADGIPQPFCTCDTCTEARRTGEVRCPGGVLIDGELLIDAPPGLGAAVARAGVDLTGVRTMAISHAHSDHWDPAILLHRSWQTPERPLRIIAPAAVLDIARQWLAPHSPVELVTAQPGAGINLENHFVRVLPATHGRTAHGRTPDPWAAEAVLFEVLSDDAALFYGADTGLPDHVLLAAVAEAQYDVALLELTFGRTGPTTPGHLDHTTFPATLDAFREVGAIGPDTDVVAIHLGHHNPPAIALEAALTGWGARTVPDGTHLDYRGEQSAPPRRPRRPRTVLVTGGVRSGKSAYAEAQAAADGEPVTYLATGWTAGEDAEWNRRIADHAARRPAHWHTVETTDPAAALANVEAGTVVIDCLAVWLTRLLDDAHAWEDAGLAQATVAAATDALTTALARCRASRVFIVTNEVGSGVVPASSSGRLFRDLLGRLNSTVAEHCDEVVLLVAGRPLRLDGPQPPTPSDTGEL
ncbi:MAG: Adenosylcobinamide kinase [Actinomycetota bacterium]|nr:Adenosylcobinamide kinase [Actinomycetota bacterium]